MESKSNKSYDLDQSREVRTDRRERDSLTLAEKEVAVGKIGDALNNRRGSNFFLDTYKRAGNEDSAHDVFFATSEGKGARATTIAIKRFRDHKDASHELSSTMEITKRGFWTFKPVGKCIYKLPDELGFGFVTEYMPRLKTMDEENWSHYQDTDGDYHILHQGTLQSIGRFLGQLHGAGITHGDLQLKNIGRRPDVGYLAIDLEDCQLFDPQTDDSETLSIYPEKCIDDLKELIGSLAEHGYFGRATEGLFADQIERNLIFPYLGAAGHEKLFNKTQLNSLEEEAIIKWLQEKRNRHNLANHSPSSRENEPVAA